MVFFCVHHLKTTSEKCQEQILRFIRYIPGLNFGNVEMSYLVVWQLWYALAKTLSEHAAWALAMDRKLNMVSINAGLVLGPGVSQQNPLSTMSYLKGTDACDDIFTAC